LVQPGRLLCLGHWKGLPHPIRAKVNRLWREYRHAEKGIAQLMAARAYQSAAREAIADASARPVEGGGR